MARLERKPEPEPSLPEDAGAGLADPGEPEEGAKAAEAETITRQGSRSAVAAAVDSATGAAVSPRDQLHGLGPSAEAMLPLPEDDLAAQLYLAQLYLPSAGRLPIHYAINAKNAAVLRHILDRGGTDQLTQRNSDGALPIHYACGNLDGASLETLKLLLDVGGDEQLLEQDDAGNLPIYYLAQCSATTGHMHTDVIKFVLETGGVDQLTHKNKSGAIGTAFDVYRLMSRSDDSVLTPWDELEPDVIHTAKLLGGTKERWDDPPSRGFAATIAATIAAKIGLEWIFG